VTLDWADSVWCAQSSALAKGFITILGVGTLGFFLRVRFDGTNRSAGSAADQARSRIALRKTRFWLRVAFPAWVATIGLYCIVYVRVDGKGCDATLTDAERRLVVAGLATALVLVLSTARMAYKRWKT
jgi:hypothetical protein